MIKKNLIRLLDHSKKYIYQQVMWQWLALICQIVLIWQVTSLIDRAAGKELRGENVAYGIALIVAAAVVRVLCDRRAVRASYLASSDVKRVLREKIYTKLLRLGSSYREHVSSSELVQLMGEGVEQLETYFGKYLSQFFYSLLAPLTLFLVLFRVNLPASIVLLVCVPLIPGVIMAIQTIAKKLLSKYWDIYAELGDSFLENLQGMTALKTYQADARKQVEMDAESEHFRKITMKVLQMQLNSVIVMDVVAYGGAAVGMVVTLSQFAKGNVTFGGALMIILLASEFFIPMRQLGSFFHIAMNGMAASDRMFAFLALPEPEAGTERMGEKSFGLSLQHVTFTYPGAEHAVLHDVSFDIPSGSFAALVGLSGCGKSTIAGLLSGNNRGYEGNVFAGGHEVSKLDPDNLHSHLTLVSSDSFLFRGTVRENLLPARPSATDEEMWDALRRVRLDGFLMEEKGLDTPVTSGGTNLSGGQRQRLAFARALLHDSDIYIFDEATSNIDIESEELIMQVVHEMAGQKTVLLISHRLANAVRADRIFFLDNGAVAEEGTHAELMERNGQYAALYREQKALEEYGKEAAG